MVNYGLVDWEKFTVLTYNNPLKYIMATAKLKAVEQKWASVLSRFNFEIKYRSDWKNGNANALSRHPHPEVPDDSQDNDDGMKVCDVAAIMGLIMLLDNLQKATYDTPFIAMMAELCSDNPPSPIYRSFTKTELAQFQQADPDISRVICYLTTFGTLIGRTFTRRVKLPRPYYFKLRDLNFKMEFFRDKLLTPSHKRKFIK